jgi:hypothetical protein
MEGGKLSAFHSRHTGAGYKPLIGAVVKSYGIERMKNHRGGRAIWQLILSNLFI